MKLLRGWLSAAHPFPLVMVLTLTALIAFATADARPNAMRLAWVMTAMLFSQLSIGWSNDYLDREVDALYQPWKPVPARLVDASRMPAAIGLVLAVSGIAGAMLGPVPLLLLLIGTLCGLAYNLWLKATPLSPLPFIVAFMVLPLFVWTALGVLRVELLLLYPIGLTLPVAVHIANVLPDLEADRSQGRPTIAVRLGRRRAIALTKALQLLPLLLVAVSWQWLDYNAGVLGAALGIYAVLSLAAAALYTCRGRERDVWAFRLLVLGAIVFAGGWLAAI